MSSISLALLIFGLCYLVIITERIHKTIVSLCGAAVMIGLGIDEHGRATWQLQAEVVALLADLQAQGLAVKGFGSGQVIHRETAKG